MGRLQAGGEVHSKNAREKGAQRQRDLGDAEREVQVQDFVSVVVHGDGGQLLLSLNVL